MRIAVTGAGGFIGHHLVKRLKADGHWVRGVDVKQPEFEDTCADEFVIADLRTFESCLRAADGVHDVYQLAADMGGIGYIAANHAVLTRNNMLINSHMLEAARVRGVTRYLYTSSACVYPSFLQDAEDAPPLREAEAIPADPEKGYGWEKLFTEQLVSYYHEEFGLDTRIVRFHNIYGPLGAYDGGREKAPAAICRKVALAQDGAAIEIWGDGKQTRSFCYIDDCIEGMRRVMESGYTQPINLGRDDLVTIDDLVDVACQAAGKRVQRRYDLSRPQGVRGRNSDNTVLKEVTGWRPSTSLQDGIARTYGWIAAQIAQSPSPAPKPVSVILPTRNDEPALPTALDSVLAQDYAGAVEVIVADGSDTPATAELLRRRYPSVRVIDNPEHSTSAGLNRALWAATGEIIVRCDSGCVLPPSYVTRAVATLERTGAANVGGRQHTVGATVFERAVAMATSTMLGVGDARYRLGGPEGAADTVYLGVWSRATLDAMGGFNPDLRKNQDYELNWRLRRQGKTVWFDPDLAVVYHPRGNLRALARQYFDYGRWKSVMLRYHPASLRVRQIIPPLLVAGLAASAVLALMGAGWPALTVPLVYLLTLALGAALLGMRRHDPAAVLVPLVLATMHLSWGAGFFLPPLGSWKGRRAG